ncbi:hypothetical protein PVAND_016557 [Polypedilum vanderplanki]|uniref:Uncharacterized protein n=1 Tax=Polypedilum vanderplanki TaxID=319348 RepID=A0A9J6BGM4_POLVA|nr:hypothetical protein PVAND_016557 [Polypedilum vanderplanki]
MKFVILLALIVAFAAVSYASPVPQNKAVGPAKGAAVGAPKGSPAVGPKKGPLQRRRKLRKGKGPNAANGKGPKNRRLQRRKGKLGPKLQKRKIPKKV